MNQLLKFSFSWSFSFFPLHFILLFVFQCPPQRPSLCGFTMASWCVCQVFLGVSSPYHSLLLNTGHALLYSIAYACLAGDIESLQHTLKECSQAVLLWSIIFENKKQNVIVRFKAHLALVKNSLTQTLPYVSDRGSHISTRGSLDKSLSKALADPAREDLDRREERYTQILNFSDLEIIYFPSHHGRNEKTAECRQIIL